MVDRCQPCTQENSITNLRNKPSVAMNTEQHSHSEWPCTLGGLSIQTKFWAGKEDGVGTGCTTSQEKLI